MTTFTDSRHSIRELIRSFAQADERFDRADVGDRIAICHNLDRLNHSFVFLLSLPVKEANVQILGLLSPEDLSVVADSIPRENTTGEVDPVVLRELLREKLYLFLIRLDHCDDKQLQERMVCLPTKRCLSLPQLNQLVTFMMNECLRQIDEALPSVIESQCLD